MKKTIEYFIYKSEEMNLDLVEQDWLEDEFIGTMENLAY